MSAGSPAATGLVSLLTALGICPRCRTTWRILCLSARCISHMDFGEVYPLERYFRACRTSMDGESPGRPRDRPLCLNPMRSVSTRRRSWFASSIRRLNKSKVPSSFGNGSPNGEYRRGTQFSGSGTTKSTVFRLRGSGSKASGETSHRKTTCIWIGRTKISANATINALPTLQLTLSCHSKRSVWSVTSEHKYATLATPAAQAMFTQQGSRQWSPCRRAMPE